MNQLHSRNYGLLFVSPSLWPQPNMSAAGVRTTSLLNYFASSKQNTFQQVHYGCGLKSRDGLQEENIPGVLLHHLPANRAEEMKRFLHCDKNKNLKVVVFDRFFAEEAYSFHFHVERPDILRVLDMQDMHSLRYHREDLVKRMDSRCGHDKFACFKDYAYLTSTPKAPHSDASNMSSKNPESLLMRELSAIHRSDLTLVCSPFEHDLLTHKFGIDPGKLVIAPFFTEKGTEGYPCGDGESQDRNCYENRRDFVAIGGFKHRPNVDQVFMLKHLWPKLKSMVPDAKLHIYGALPPLRVQQLNDRANDFLVHGYVDNLYTALGCSRVLLAPLRFGAGIKGKIIDAWRFGCPTVTTPIGAEGIGENQENWGGVVATDEEDFISAASKLYNDKEAWNLSQNNARHLLSVYFDAKTNLSRVHSAIVRAVENLDSRRSEDFVSAMLWQSSMRSTEYMSRWIELKESIRN